MRLVRRHYGAESEVREGSRRRESAERAEKKERDEAGEGKRLLFCKEENSVCPIFLGKP